MSGVPAGMTTGCAERLKLLYESDTEKRRKPWRDPAAQATPSGQPPTNPLGVRGLGKACVVGVAAAIANALSRDRKARAGILLITLDKSQR